MKKKRLFVWLIALGIFICLIGLGCWLVGIVKETKEGKTNTLSEALIFTDKLKLGYDQKIVKEDIRALTQAIEAEPMNPELFAARGFVYAATHQYAKAIKDFEIASWRSPTGPSGKEVNIFILGAPSCRRIAFLLALAYWQKGEMEQAQKYMAIVISENPKYALGYYYHGLIFWNRGEKQDAARFIKEAIKLKKDKIFIQTLAEIQGEKSERIASTFVISFFPKQPPQSRPFGYVWQIKHHINNS